MPLATLKRCAVNYLHYMQFSFLKILLALGTVAILGGIAWYVLKPEPSQTGVLPSQNGTGFLSQTSVGTTPGSESQTQSQAPTDFEQAYAQLFQDILAKKIEFAPVNSASGGAEAGVYKLYEADVAQSKSFFPSGEVSVDVALIDINEDGSPEALIYENLPGFCGSGGCPFDIYQQQQGKWVRLSSFLGGPNIGLSNTYVNGYLDFFLSESGDMGSESKIIRYRWDGKEYRVKELVALWDGSRFTLIQ